MAIVQSPATPLPDPWGLKWWVFWDNTTGSNVDPSGEVVTEIDWDNTAGVARIARILMKDGSVILASIAAGASGSHTLNKPQQQAWQGLQFLLA